MIWQCVDSSAIGGIESHMAALTLALRAKGREATIVLLEPHGDNPWLAQLRAMGVPFDVLSGGIKPLLSALRHERPDILHTHGYKAGILGRLAARLAGVPVVSTFHAGERGPFPVSLYQSLDGLTSCLGARIAVDAEIAEKLPFGAEIIRNFIALPTRPPALPRPASIGFVGRLSPEKGPDLFCELAERTDASIAFHIFGDGPMRPDLETRYRGRVQFHGVEADMAGVWPRLGLLLMPSRAEGMPMAALEALAHGVPVAAARVGALPDLLSDGETGWLFAAGDVAGASNAIRRWASLPDSERLAMSERCRAVAEARFGPDEPVAAVAAIYDRISRPVLAAA